MQAQTVSRACAALSTLIALVFAVSPALAEPTCTASFQCDDGNPCTTDRLPVGSDYRPRVAATARHTHPAMKHAPPTGVMAPSARTPVSAKA